ncbi:isochorismatase family cysteine hydrolase [Pantoea phytobeneficialis]|uniref:Isochorismatase n=1 Tax=Pantoea phytobeneficialis TaxID=2052056 RepID=A0AAP9HAY2_9GAMM|nr:isochorismatase family cysteine hydrolase [Pantoea phytobeneficialis]MDO6409933.1 isochorismatase family cysteine hydrolase [Pantoea phytobeneficialis]QGR09787.1 isochorismatase [Pantoea phytobeneficialis]
MFNPSSRNIPIEKQAATLLFVDVQNYNARRDGGEYVGMSTAEQHEKFGYFFDIIERETIANMQKVQAACRASQVEVMYTVIESLTKDGRDRSLDYKITGFNVPRDSWDAQVLEAIAPADDEIVLSKTSSSVFISTNIDYVLRNLGTRYLVIAGFLTDQCIESAVRDACDLGYLVTLVTDACATLTPERQQNSLNAIKGYCRQVTTQDFLNELAAG